MWTWVWNLRKCFGNNREQSPPPEDTGGWEPEGNVSPVPSPARQTTIEPTDSTEACTPGSPSGRLSTPSIIDTVSSPELSSAAAVPAMRASPLLKATTGRPRRTAGAHHSSQRPSPARQRQNSSPGQAHRDTNQRLPPSKAAQGLVRRPSSGVKRPSRLAVSTPAQPRSFEETPLEVHHTPFNVRLERQLQRSAGTAIQNEASRSSGSPDWTAPVVVGRDTAANVASSTGRDAWTTDGPHAEKAAASNRGLGSPSRQGKENSARNSRGFGKSGGAFSAGEVATGGTVLKPKLQIKLPDSGGPFATSLQTPSPTANPRFVVTSDDSFGTPDVVGVANLLSQYREDRRLRVHETPFEERVERFMETERVWKEQRLSLGASKGSA